MKFRHDLSNILFSMTLCHITPSLLSKWIPSTLQQTSTYLLNKIRWKLTKTKINHQKYLYLNIIYTNFSIKGRCWYYSRYPGIPMHIKIPIGPSWQFVGNLYPTPTQKGKTITTEPMYYICKCQCNRAVLELIKQNMRWVKKGKSTTSPEIMSQHIVRLSLPQVSK